jgi:diguanylate cyclase (GGDEF)-like protein
MTSLTVLQPAGETSDGGPDRDALHAMQREVLEAIAAGKPLRAVGRLLAGHLARLAPTAACGLMLVDEAGRLRALAAAGMPDAVLDELDNREAGRDAGTCGAAAVLGRPVETVDIAADPRWRECDTAALAAGLRTCRSTPVRVLDGRVVGTVAFYFSGHHGPDAKTRELAAAGAHLAALAIEHDRAHQSLHEAGTRFAQALDSLPQGVSFLDADRRLLFANRRFAAIYDLDEDALQPGLTPQRLMALRRAAGSGPAVVPGDSRGHRRQPSEPPDGPIQADGEMELANGRVIAVGHRPVAGGGWIATHEDVTERRRAEARIVYLAQHDALTGLLNRTLFQERLGQALVRASPGQQCAALLLDLDRFKAVNEGFGHAVGDQVLQVAAARLRGCVRDRDTPTRMGGDKFAVLLVGIAGPEAAGEVAQRMLRALSEPYAIDNRTIEIGVSIGVAVTPDDGVRGDILLRSAELALYRAKAEERGSYRFFEAGMDARLHERIALKTDLRTALEAGEFELYYQPLIGPSGGICCFEALLRWHHPTRGTVSPAEFIPLAEETGLIVPLGDWVLQRACAEAAQWPAPVKVAVNLSPAQFRRRSLVETVRAALAASGLTAVRLELEITESLLLANTEATLGMLHELRALGVGIAMDDFGSGYSSLRYLRSFPFDKVKIDRSFIRDLPDQADSISIVSAVVTLCRSLGIATTAEGVETEPQMQHLRDEGCTELQGFLFSRPRPAGEVPLLLEDPAPRWSPAA